MVQLWLLVVVLVYSQLVISPYKWVGPALDIEQQSLNIKYYEPIDHTDSLGPYIVGYSFLIRVVAQP